MQEETFHYTEPDTNEERRLRLRLVSRDEKTIVLVSKDPDHAQSSSASDVEALALAVCERYGIDPHRLVWIEQTLGHQRPKYGGEVPGDPWDLATFTWDGNKLGQPSWSLLMRDEVEQMIGQPLED